MFEDISDISVEDLSAIKNPETPSYSNDKSKFFAKKKEQVVEKPYVPVAMYVDREFPEEVKNNLFRIASRLISKDITVRLNGDDKDFSTKLAELSDTHTELYIPWKNFNNLESKNYFNTLTSNSIAVKHFSGWEKIPDSVRAMLSRNVRMIFGDKNNSICLCLITWSKDGASRLTEINKDTGRSSFIIKVACSYGFPVLNLQKSNAEGLLEKTFGI